MKIENKYALKILGVLTVISTIVILFGINYNGNNKEINKCAFEINKNIVVDKNIVTSIEQNEKIDKVDNAPIKTNKNINKVDKIFFFDILLILPNFIFISSIFTSIILLIISSFFYFKKDEKAKKISKISGYLFLYSFLIFIILSIVNWLIRVYYSNYV